MLIDWCLTPTLAKFQLYRGVISHTDNKHKKNNNPNLFILVGEPCYY